MQISLSATVIPNTLTLKYALTLSVMKAAFFNSARLIAATSAHDAYYVTWKHALSARASCSFGRGGGGAFQQIKRGARPSTPPATEGQTRSSWRIKCTRGSRFAHPLMPLFLFLGEKSFRLM
jgi:hypothetical protein